MKPQSGREPLANEKTQKETVKPVERPNKTPYDPTELLGFSHAACDVIERKRGPKRPKTRRKTPTKSDSTVVLLLIRCSGAPGPRRRSTERTERSN